jgi:hypothetical protein
MNEVVKVADEIDHEKMMQIIFGFLTAILFLLPVAGEVVGTVAALANIAKVLAAAGVLGNVAMGVYGVVESKGNDPMAIFDLIMAPLGLASSVSVGKAANIRRAMNPENIKKLGRVGDRLKMVEDVKAKGGVCRLAKRDLESWEMSQFRHMSQFGTMR